MNNQRPHIAFATTIPGTIRAFMVPHLVELSKRFDVIVYCNLNTNSYDVLQTIFKDYPVRFVHVNFERKIKIFSDIQSWCRLYYLLRRDRPASLHSMMPKTGLLAMTAGLLAGVPIRIHMFTGQVWATQIGWKRQILKVLDQMIARAATRILTDSPSQRTFLIENGFPTEMQVLGVGSVCGVNLARFRPNAIARKKVRATYGIGDKDLVFGFLGRMNRDKGIPDLLSAFEKANLPKHCHLMLVGPDEENIVKILERLKPHRRERVHICGHTDCPESFFAAFDVFCLPSYREGFGTSVIEAAACGVPALVSEIYGLTDAVLANKTGLFHPPADIDAIALGMEKFAADTFLSQVLGEAARHRAQRHFSEDVLVTAMQHFYDNLKI